MKMQRCGLFQDSSSRLSTKNSPIKADPPPPWLQYALNARISLNRSAITREAAIHHLGSHCKETADSVGMILLHDIIENCIHYSISLKWNKKYLMFKQQVWFRRISLCWYEGILRVHDRRGYMQRLMLPLDPPLCPLQPRSELQVLTS